MIRKRIVWKDSSAPQKEHTYRGHVISRYKCGWIVDLPEDNNIYYSLTCAQNALDQALKGKTRRDATARHALGIRIIGTK